MWSDIREYGDRLGSMLQHPTCVPVRLQEGKRDDDQTWGDLLQELNKLLDSRWRNVSTLPPQTTISAGERQNKQIYPLALLELTLCK